ncbi:glycoside hydrolase family 2 TIM barrel-domain containing protein [Modestobacter sp. VKM Ac-2984]|uniref:glycoside hydrolase family 2 TIM barrel-domain containing protein n=1 Tax=Modestobacter sp. VKM Ac-2984 TaxID=3004138 RepID=UPI0022AA8980|nr:glycoside hydrolase family 2 TIM barrel-domain containing protein [Modestobacter sp. VKM Ac-2984]MCZ2815944.1 DUF4982 domain-containing protein [Modestobacter sp. VKM Ac-2984]
MRRTPFTAGWQFRPHANSFAEMHGAAQPWRDVVLPHDATLGQPRDAEHGPAAGYFPPTAVEYRAVLPVTGDDHDQVLALHFQGVYRSARVLVNGQLAATWSSGWTEAVVPLADHLRYDGTDEVRVLCRAGRDARWYAGAGIHRPVHLLRGPLVHLAADGVRVVTEELDGSRAVVSVASTVVHAGRGLASRTVRVRLVDDAGAVVAEAVSPVTVLPGEPAVVRQRLLVADPAPWSPTSPRLHTVEAVLLDGDVETDTETVTTGLRTLSLDPERGLRINGQTVLLRGACVHSDNGVLGSAAIGRADERRVELLAAAGFNALRSSHNPMSRAMLAACDRVGVLVMDELTDTWTQGKSTEDDAGHFADTWRSDVASMVRRGANHPSIVLWSIGNEIPEVSDPRGALWSRRLAEAVRAEDPTRFVTNGVNAMLAVIEEARGPQAAELGINTMLTDMGEFMDHLSGTELVARRTEESFDVLDVAGMNYMEARYAIDRELFPRRVIVGSETFATKSDRLWRLVQDHPHVIGDFTWTGWDYLGEAGVGRVADSEDPAAGGFHGPFPWLLAWCGDLDITGHRRPASYYRETVFGLRTAPAIVVVRPERSGRTTVSTPWAWADSVADWAFTGAEGVPLTVEVYSDAEEVELLLGNRSLGTAPAGEAHRFRAEFTVPWAPEDLVAVARTGGAETGRTVLRPASGPVGLVATADRTVLRADDADLAFVAIALTDVAGTVALGVDREVTVTVEGAGTLVGLGSAAPATAESYLDAVHTTFDGRALAVVRPTGPGTITVTATAEGCAPVTVSVEAR